jgi:plastocyanin
MRFARAVVLVAMVTAMLVACGDDDARDGALVVDDPAAVEADYEYVIPLGTGARFDAGEAVEILPGEMVVQVGEVMRIVNHDDRHHLIGPFFVGAGETLTQRFASAGEFTGLCTVHPSGEFVLTVTE